MSRAVEFISYFMFHASVFLCLTQYCSYGLFSVLRSNAPTKYFVFHSIVFLCLNTIAFLRVIYCVMQ